MTFVEDWFPKESRKALATLARRTLELKGQIVEIGSWEGRSTIALANAVAPATVHAVDTWEGSPGEISADLAASRDVHATWTQNVASGTAGNVRGHRESWRSYFLTHRERCRFVFIDAEHTYREVYDNITEVIPLMVSGGIICGDDRHHPPVQQAVLEHFPDAKTVATLWWFQCP